ncbi:hypothetical protein ACH6EH_10965 [Paenibacillus sp. JSM ZJ436]|uniref:hypothetical protein n=1 Tax=Paenibacillus sp. JSM ZJ436 TaxID=3376190 RepID=UPI003793AE79
MRFKRGGAAAQRGERAIQARPAAAQRGERAVQARRDRGTVWGRRTVWSSMRFRRGGTVVRVVQGF